MVTDVAIKKQITVALLVNGHFCVLQGNPQRTARINHMVAA
jgi:hypothetical protein